MTLRKIALAIGIAIAVAVVVVLLLQHGLITKIPWIEKKHGPVLLKPEGSKILTIEPNVVYKVDALYGSVPVISSVEVLNRGFTFICNITHGQYPFAISVDRLFIDVDRPSDYIISLRPLGDSLYRLSIMINGTHICVMRFMMGKWIKIVKCDLPYVYASKTSVDIGYEKLWTCSSNKGVTACGINESRVILEVCVDATPLGGSDSAKFYADIGGIGTFMLRLIG